MKRLFSPIGSGPQRRSVVVAALAGAVGLMAAAWLTAPDNEALQALEHEVAQLQILVQGMPVRPSPSGQAQAAAATMTGPAQGQQVAIWPWLQQRLQEQGLQVQALRPQPMVEVQSVHEQPVTLRLQGAWGDWLAFEQAMDAYAPWWGIDQWLVLPSGQKSADVRLELQARLSLQPVAPDAGDAPAWHGPAWGAATDARVAGAEVFAAPQSAASTRPPLVGDAPLALDVDPRRWPLSRLQLLGIWQQAGAAHAVLGGGLDTVVVGPGQRVGQEAYRVRRVNPVGVDLVAPDGAAAALHLKQQGDPR